MLKTPGPFEWKMSGSDILVAPDLAACLATAWQNCGNRYSLSQALESHTRSKNRLVRSQGWESMDFFLEDLTGWAKFFFHLWSCIFGTCSVSCLFPVWKLFKAVVGAGLQRTSLSSKFVIVGNGDRMDMNYNDWKVNVIYEHWTTKRRRVSHQTSPFSKFSRWETSRGL